MAEKDVPKVTEALNKHLEDNYKVHITFSEAEVAHFLLPRQNVMWSYVVEDEDGNISDFASFYALNSSILVENEWNYTHLMAAYCFYNFVKDNDPQRQRILMRDVLIQAKNEEFDVFNMVAVLQNKEVTDDMMFKPGDGKLSHYFYNWRISKVEENQIGIVLV